MNPESFPTFTADDGTSYTVRRDLLRYHVVHITPDGTAGTPTTLAVAASFESRHAAVAAALRLARQRRTG